MSFQQQTYQGLISKYSETQARLFDQYAGDKLDFDIIVIGSGMGGGILADDLADRLGSQKRILVLEAGSYLFPTHVYNICRFPNYAIAGHFAVKTFSQYGNGEAQHYIHEQPQLNFGGRSIFWSGLIPTIQPWELAFFPDVVKKELADYFLRLAGNKMNESVSMGNTAQQIVTRLQQSSLSTEFEIMETPRALHQPYLTDNGLPSEEFFVEPTGIFNTAELLINQAGLASYQKDHHANGLHLLLNHYVEDILPHHYGESKLIVRDTLNGQIREFYAKQLILAGGSIESPKLLNRSTLGRSLPEEVKGMIGKGLTDHPTTDWIGADVTHLQDIPIPRNTHAKIVLYSKGLRDDQNQIKYPFNVEMNINHEYWHLRENDPSEPAQLIQPSGTSKVEIKFSFANCLDDENEVKPAAPYGYVPEVMFKNLHWMDHLAGSRFPALAGWQKSYEQIFAILNDISADIFSQFSLNGSTVHPQGAYGSDQIDFGFGTVHHAVGTLRMPYRPRYDAALSQASVVDENLKVKGADNVFVCDMSVMPISSAANPVRTLAGLALRLSQHLGG